MPTLEARTTVYRPRPEVFDALLDLRRYESYSEYLVSVTRDGDGEAGTEYRLRFAWWLLEYTLKSRVTGVDRPNRLEFEVVEGIAASGSWQVDHAPSQEPDDPASVVTFEAEYDPTSVSSGAIDLPALTSLDWVIDRVAPLVEGEAERVVKRVIADLEGREREIDLEITVE